MFAWGRDWGEEGDGLTELLRSAAGERGTAHCGPSVRTVWEVCDHSLEGVLGLPNRKQSVLSSQDHFPSSPGTGILM